MNAKRRVIAASGGNRMQHKPKCFSGSTYRGGYYIDLQNTTKNNKQDLQTLENPAYCRFILIFYFLGVVPASKTILEPIRMCWS